VVDRSSFSSVGSLFQARGAATEKSPVADSSIYSSRLIWGQHAALRPAATTTVATMGEVWFLGLRG